MKAGARPKKTVQSSRRALEITNSLRGVFYILGAGIGAVGWTLVPLDFLRNSAPPCRPGFLKISIFTEKCFVPGRGHRQFPLWRF